MSDYKFIRKDENKIGGRIAFYINDQLPSWTIKIENPSDIEILICPKLCGNCAFPQNFHTRKLGEITVFFATNM